MRAVVGRRSRRRWDWPRLLDGVRQWLAESGCGSRPPRGWRRRCGQQGRAARGRRSAGRGRAAALRAGRQRAAGAAARRPVGDRRAGHRARPGVGGPGRRPGADGRLASRTPRPYGGSRSGSRRWPGGGWTTPGPGSTPGCRTAPACTRCCRRSPSAATCLSLRVVRPRAFTLDELVAAGTVPPGGDRVLRALLDARLSFLISGGTGSGKTTLLSALLGLVGPGERIVLAEDSAELRPDHPHVVRLEARPANQEGAGLVALRGPGAPGAADAARPAGGRRGARARRS